jgi:hypothetical protein
MKLTQKLFTDTLIRRFRPAVTSNTAATSFPVQEMI